MKTDTDIPVHVPPGWVGPDKFLLARDKNGVVSQIVINSMEPAKNTITVFDCGSKSVKTLNITDYRFFEDLEVTLTTLNN